MLCVLDLMPVTLDLSPLIVCDEKQDYGFYGGGGEDSPGGDFSPGLLDLHSFDTELLPEVWGLLTFPQSAFVNLTWVLTFCKCFLVWVLSKCQHNSLFI